MTVAELFLLLEKVVDFAMTLILVGFIAPCGVAQIIFSSSYFLMQEEIGWVKREEAFIYEEILKMFMMFCYVAAVLIAPLGLITVLLSISCSSCMRMRMYSEPDGEDHSEGDG